MKNLNPIILLFAGLGVLFIGNTMAEQGGVLDIIGTGLGLFGGLLFFYSLFLAIKWVWKKIKGEKKRAD